MKDIIHNSALSRLRDCEQRYVYEYVEGLGGDRSVALDVGTWFHTLMEAQGYKQGTVQGTLLHALPDEITFGLDPEDSPSVPLELVSTDGIPEPRKVHEWLTNEVHAYWPEGDEDRDAMPDNVWFLYERYMARWGREMAREKVLGVEVQWSRSDMPDFEGSREIAYGGQIDRIVVNSQGLTVLRDHKTTSSKPDANFRLVNSQLHLYAWGVHPWLAAQGITLDAIEYDYALTYWPTVRLTKAGNLYKNQKVIDDYAASRMLRDMLEVSDGEYLPDQFQPYLDECRAIGNDEFFPRHIQPVNETTVHHLLDEGAVLMARADRLHKGIPAVRSTGRQCGWCPYADICTGDLLGNDTTPLKEALR